MTDVIVLDSFIYYVSWFPFIILFALIVYLSIHAHITCIVYNLEALWVGLRIQVIGPLQSDKLFTVNSWILQSHRDCSALPHNWKDDLSYSSRWVSNGECTNVYGFILDKIYGESWHKVVSCHDSQATILHELLTLRRR